MKHFGLITAAVLAVCSSSAIAQEGDSSEIRGWTQWRGPHQTGVSDEKGLPDTWEVGGKNDLWSIQLPGRGTPVIANGRVYSWGYRGDGAELREVLVCLDAATGKQVWEHTFRDFLSDIIYDRYSIGAPTIDPETGNLYLMTSAGLLNCFTLEGKLKWQHSMMEQYGRNTYPNGRTGAPVIDGDLVIVRGVSTNWGKQGPPRDRFYAFDKRTGDSVWASTPGVGPPFLKDSCFATPVFDWWEGRRVFYSGLGSGAVVCVNAWTGEPIWRSQQIVGGINSSVVLHKGKVIVIHGRQNLDSTETGRMLALRIPKADRLKGKGPFLMDKKDEVWRNRLSMFTSSPVLVGDRIYQVVGTGELCCVDADSGKVLWQKKLGPNQIHASPLYADGKLYVPLNNGTFHILRPTDAGAEELAMVYLEGSCLGSPAAWDGRVYVHTTSRLYCFGKKGGNAKNLPAPPKPESPPKPGKAVRLTIVPNEVLLRPGEKASFKIYATDANGQRVKEIGEPVTWEKFIPPTAKVKAKMDAEFNNKGELVAGPKAMASAGAYKATFQGLSGTIRGRVVVNLPYTEDFESFKLTVPHKSEKGVMFAYPPLAWIGARFKWEVRERDGSKVLAKTTDRMILQRAITFIGHPDESNYTLSADLMSDGNRRGMGEMGVINQRYLIRLRGNHDRIEVTSNLERLREWKEFALKPRVWYRLKTKVDVDANGTGMIRAKCWPRDGQEPAAWTIEVKHEQAHRKGVPGLYGFSAQPIQRVYVDNIEIKN